METIEVQVSGVQDEKREERRYGCRSRVAWTYFNRAEVHQGRLCDFSQAGASFESPEALNAGAAILIRVEDHPAECRPDCRAGGACPWPRSHALGEIKWCRAVPAATGPSEGRFQVGMRFFAPP